MNRNIKYILIFIVLTILIVGLQNYFNTKIEILKTEEYDKISQSTQSYLESLIENKKRDTLSIALILADYEKIKKSIIDKSANRSDLELISLKLKDHTSYKNVWIQLIDNDGISLARSWSDKSGDDLKPTRPDINRLIEKPEIKSSISVGKFDLTFKANVPIYEPITNKFVGILEVISHFNSIVNELKKDNFLTIILVDKIYKEQFIEPTKNFIDDYYIVNNNLDDESIKKIKKIGLDNLIKIKNYIIIEENFILKKVIKDSNDRVLGYFFIFKSLKNIDYTRTNDFIDEIKFFLSCIITMVLLIIYLSYRRKKDIEQQSIYYQLILDSSSDILIVTDGKKAIYVNKSFFEYFKNYKNFEEFEKNTICICNLFLNRSGYLKKQMGELNWIEYILQRPNDYHKVLIELDSKEIVFNIRAKNLKDTIQNRYVVVLSDITKIEKYKSDLEKLVSQKIDELRNKDELLIQNAKMIAMGEMVGAISHQWKQPLNMLSLLIEELEDDIFYDGLKIETIEKFTNKSKHQIEFMSKTIEDFRNFLKPNKKIETFDLKRAIIDVIDILDKQLIKNSIKLTLNITNDIAICSYKGELQQVILNFINNSKDALLEKKLKSTENHLELTIEIVVDELNSDTIKISIIDNAGSIPLEIQNKIFTLYFTTKSEKDGTGMGLYLCKMITEDSLKGKIYFSSLDKTIFSIEIPKKLNN